MKYIVFLIDNIFLKNGDILVRQIKGIPMGTNSGPGLANIYLYSYESRFIDKLSNEEHKDIAAKFHASFRLIDDTLSVDNEFWKQYAEKCYEDGGIYPRCLKYNPTRLAATVTNFLGIHIQLTKNGYFHTSVYDKRKDFGFKIQNYPDMKSLIPESQPYGTFTGSLHRMYGIISDSKIFIQTCSELAVTMIQKGCNFRKLRMKLQRFLNLQVPLRWNRMRLRPAGRLLDRFSQTVRALQREPSD
jgi:hypothetical protein